jgi:hypothetical protein
MSSRDIAETSGLDVKDVLKVIADNPKGFNKHSSLRNRTYSLAE